MAIRKLPEITAEQENFRMEPVFADQPSTWGMQRIKRDPVEPVPVGTFVGMIFKITGYDQDCDGSLMARLEHVDKDGEPTGWEADAIGLYSDTDVVLDAPGDLHDLIEGDDA